MRGVRTFNGFRRLAMLLFFLAAAAAVIWQLYLQKELRTVFGLYENMKTECSASDVRMAMQEMEYFPVREDETHKAAFFFDNSYGAARTYGGNRTHEGIDIMTSNNSPGYFEIQSVSDGVVEQIGWLSLGGYRIGIRSDSGIYYYYAHLDSYAKGIQKGDKISAGQLLGTMGDTGYGEEGTRGKFDVHLHFGMYRQADGEDVSCNPYYLLQYLSEKWGYVE
ncbi:MAG: M23 family metallopeptidase [Clostridiaceae bacterium]|nr:M23 family metallopeptidase [Clostridiaceae bacterium]